MAEHYSIIEPLSNLSNDSKLERVWKSFGGKFGIIQSSRIIQFDPYTSMSRQPTKYLLKPFSVPSTLPDQNWLSDALQSFIHEEFSQNDQMFTEITKMPTVDEEVFIPDNYLDKFLQQSEWENSIEISLPKDNSINEMAEAIYRLLCNPLIGSSKNKQNNKKDVFVDSIYSLLKQKKRLFFVLPSFPFKDQNRFRVPYDASVVDYSELSFLIRLHNFIQALYQVHPYGADAIILSDGRLYKEIFAIDDSQVEKYQWLLKDLRNKLNIQGDVSIIDLKELIERADEDGEITRICSYIKTSIVTSFVDKPFFSALIQGMKWNLNSKELLRDLSDEDAWEILKKPKADVKYVNLKKWDELNRIATRTAIEYAAINLTLKWTNLIHLFFPEAIRCTVHPKKDQFALAMNYAWNGVAWSEKWPKSSNDISTVPFYLLSGFKNIKQVKTQGGIPCFFTTEQACQVFDNAKSVLNAEGWETDGIFGREFNIYDLNEFISLGRDDENFSWERQLMSDDYYSALLKFRISHYKKYGFGVHAIFNSEGKLIGQMGLQVLDEKSSLIEYVIFIGKNYTNQGIGTRLLEYLFARCKCEGIQTIYGVIRNDNEISKKIAKKFGGHEVRIVAHYQQTGILYQIDL